MSEMKQENEKKDSGFRLVIPFFLTLAVLTVVSFIIPLRPTQSNMEKRNLAEFPEFSTEALLSGDYFDDISTWFSDTFPGREEWLELSSDISSLHGYSDIIIQGDIPLGDIDAAEEETVPNTEETVAQEEADSAEEPETAEETLPEETGWGGVDAGDDDVIQITGVIQIGDSAFNIVGFSEIFSKRYAETISKFAEKADELGARVVSAPCPTAVGIMVEKEYLDKLGCADQEGMIDYVHSLMSDQVITVDTFDALIGHNDEYIYFRTDHHWTALGAYYSYEAICEALGYEAAPLDSFEVWDQGTFQGSLYWKSAQPKKLTLDTVYSYIPQGDIETMIYNQSGYGRPAQLLQDMSNREINSTYLTFIEGDNPMTVITNHSLPDAPDCLLVKDSYGNCMAPFFTQNYHNVYVLDYRKFYDKTMSKLIEELGIEDVIFVPYVLATQGKEGNEIFTYKCQ